MAKRPLFLVSNDDGVFAKGLTELSLSLRDMGDVIVVAPDEPRSGSSSAITTRNPITYSLVRSEPGLTVYSCTGTPADCVKLALNVIVTEMPDIVIAGINHGDNKGIAVNYSGTLGAAIEGCIFDIPSLAISLIHGRQESDFLACCRYARAICRRILKEGLPRGVYLNVNVPNIPRVRGLRVCSQADGRYHNEFIKQRNPQGKDVFWLSGDLVLNEPAEKGWDVATLDRGYATMVPCKIDVTAYQYVRDLQSWEEDD